MTISTFLVKSPKLTWNNYFHNCWSIKFLKIKFQNISHFFHKERTSPLSISSIKNSFLKKEIDWFLYPYQKKQNFFWEKPTLPIWFIRRTKIKVNRFHLKHFILFVWLLLDLFYTKPRCTDMASSFFTQWNVADDFTLMEKRFFFMKNMTVAIIVCMMVVVLEVMPTYLCWHFGVCIAPLLLLLWLWWLLCLFVVCCGWRNKWYLAWFLRWLLWWYGY